jgi:hypothetical protein
MNEPEKHILLKLLEMQRHTMYMYTSCGWFFDDISGIEAVQVLEYAARAIQLAKELFGQDFERPFLDRLALAKSNYPDAGNGEQIYLHRILPSIVNLTSMAAHYAISSLFEIYDSSADIYCYRAESQDYHSAESGKAKLALGRVRIKSQITYESKLYMWAVLYFGNHTLNCGVIDFKNEESYSAMVTEVMQAFSKGDLKNTLSVINRHFGSSLYSLKSLLGDQQRRIIAQILETSMEEIGKVHREVFDRNITVIKFLAEFRMPLPKALRTSAEFVLNADLRSAIEADEPDLGRIRKIFDESRACRVQLDTAGLSYLIQCAIEKVMRRLRENPHDAALVKRVEEAMDLVSRLPFELNMWQIQNIFYDVIHHNGADLDLFKTLGQKLRVAVEPALVK